MNKYILSKKEKERAIELFKELDGDLNEAAKKLFEDPNEKGSTIRGRVLRKFWVEKGFEYRTKVKKKSSKYFLQENEKDFVHRHYCAEMTKREIAQLLWTEETNHRGFYESARFIALSDFVNKEFPNVTNLRDEITGDRYAPPKIMTTVIKKVNKVVFKEFEIDKISVGDKKCLERLLTYLAAPRFIQVINAYPTKQNRELLESEYIRSTWDKPDLTSDELNLYINVCMDYINLKEIEQQKQKLNLMFDDTEAQNDLTMRLTEMLKTKSEEYNQCTNRIDKMIAKLNGERAKRISNQQQRNASVLSLVHLFQEEDERKLMIKMADMQKTLVKKEADQLEEMVDWKSRVLGISKREVI
tara:strand:- start:8507 stop:9577 length:1071 start_codon:yes stop_codon:yes gene_type:complete